MDLEEHIRLIRGSEDVDGHGYNPWRIVGYLSTILPNTSEGRDNMELWQGTKQFLELKPLHSSDSL